MRGSLFILIILILDLGQAAKITVGPSNEDYPQIQMAIDNSTNGDIIEVHSGTYQERLSVFNSVILIGLDTGKGLPLIDANGLGSAITLMAAGSTVKGFNLTGSTGCACSRNAGITVDSSNNTITDNVIFKNKYAIYVKPGCINNTFMSNNLLENAIPARDPGGNCWNNSKQKSEGLQSLLELLTGKQIKGNHYSDYDEPGEGCNDADDDGFCDQPRKIEGGTYLSPAISGRY